MIEKAILKKIKKLSLKVRGVTIRMEIYLKADNGTKRIIDRRDDYEKDINLNTHDRGAYNLEF